MGCVFAWQLATWKAEIQQDILEAGRDRWRGAHMSEYAHKAEEMNEGWNSPSVTQIKSELNSANR